MLQPNRSEIDLGEIKQGDKVSFEVELKNESTQPITPSISVSCGCTVPRLEPRTIEPGQTGILKAEYDSTGRLGDQKKLIYIKYSPNERVLSNTISFTAKVVKTQGM